jgi:hypothetical protein
MKMATIRKTVIATVVQTFEVEINESKLRKKATKAEFKKQAISYANGESEPNGVWCNPLTCTTEIEFPTEGE